MSYVQEKDRIFNEEYIKIPRLRSEARMKRYSSSEDVRVWCDEVEDRRQHFLKYLAINKGSICKEGIVPIDYLINASKWKFDPDLQSLRDRANYLENLLEIYRRLTPKKEQIQKPGELKTRKKRQISQPNIKEEDEYKIEPKPSDAKKTGSFSEIDKKKIGKEPKTSRDAVPSDMRIKELTKPATSEKPPAVQLKKGKKDQAADTEKPIDTQEKGIKQADPVLAKPISPTKDTDDIDEIKEIEKDIIKPLAVEDKPVKKDVKPKIVKSPKPSEAKKFSDIEDEKPIDKELKPEREKEIEKDIIKPLAVVDKPVKKDVKPKVFKSPKPSEAKKSADIKDEKPIEKELEPEKEKEIKKAIIKPLAVEDEPVKKDVKPKIFKPPKPSEAKKSADIKDEEPIEKELEPEKEKEIEKAIIKPLAVEDKPVKKDVKPKVFKSPKPSEAKKSADIKDEKPIEKELEPEKEKEIEKAIIKPLAVEDKPVKKDVKPKVFKSPKPSEAKKSADIKDEKPIEKELEPEIKKEIEKDIIKPLAVEDKPVKKDVKPKIVKSPKPSEAKKSADIKDEKPIKKELEPEREKEIEKAIIKPLAVEDKPVKKDVRPKIFKSPKPSEAKKSADIKDEKPIEKELEPERKKEIETAIIKPLAVEDKPVKKEPSEAKKFADIKDEEPIEKELEPEREKEIEKAIIKPLAVEDKPVKKEPSEAKKFADIKDGKPIDEELEPVAIKDKAIKLDKELDASAVKPTSSQPSKQIPQELETSSFKPAEVIVKKPMGTEAIKQKIKPPEVVDTEKIPVVKAKEALMPAEILDTKKPIADTDKDKIKTTDKAESTLAGKRGEPTVKPAVESIRVKKVPEVEPQGTKEDKQPTKLKGLLEEIEKPKSISKEEVKITTEDKSLVQPKAEGKPSLSEQAQVDSIPKKMIEVIEKQKELGPTKVVPHDKTPKIEKDDSQIAKKSKQIPKSEEEIIAHKKVLDDETKSKPIVKEKPVEEKELEFDKEKPDEQAPKKIKKDSIKDNEIKSGKVRGRGRLLPKESLQEKIPKQIEHIKKEEEKDHFVDKKESPDETIPKEVRGRGRVLQDKITKDKAGIPGDTSTKISDTFPQFSDEKEKKIKVKKDELIDKAKLEPEEDERKFDVKEKPSIEDEKAAALKISRPMLEDREEKKSEDMEKEVDTGKEIVPVKEDYVAKEPDKVQEEELDKKDEEKKLELLEKSMQLPDEIDIKKEIEVAEKDKIQKETPTKQQTFEEPISKEIIEVKEVLKEDPYFKDKAKTTEKGSKEKILSLEKEEKIKIVECEEAMTFKPDDAIKKDGDDKSKIQIDVDHKPEKIKDKEKQKKQEYEKDIDEALVQQKQEPQLLISVSGTKLVKKVSSKVTFDDHVQERELSIISWLKEPLEETEAKMVKVREDIKIEPSEDLDTTIPLDTSMKETDDYQHELDFGLPKYEESLKDVFGPDSDKEILEKGIPTEILFKKSGELDVSDIDLLVEPISEKEELDVIQEPSAEKIESKKKCKAICSEPLKLVSTGPKIEEGFKRKEKEQEKKYSVIKSVQSLRKKGKSENEFKRTTPKTDIYLESDSVKETQDEGKRKIFSKQSSLDQTRKLIPEKKSISRDEKSIKTCKASCNVRSDDNDDFLSAQEDLLFIPPLENLSLPVTGADLTLPLDLPSSDRRDLETSSSQLYETPKSPADVIFKDLDAQRKSEKKCMAICRHVKMRQPSFGEETGGVVLIKDGGLEITPSGYYQEDLSPRQNLPDWASVPRTLLHEPVNTLSISSKDDLEVKKSDIESDKVLKYPETQKDNLINISGSVVSRILSGQAVGIGIPIISSPHRKPASLSDAILKQKLKPKIACKAPCSLKPIHDTTSDEELLATEEDVSDIHTESKTTEEFGTPISSDITSYADSEQLFSAREVSLDLEPPTSKLIIEKTQPELEEKKLSGLVREVSRNISIDTEITSYPKSNDTFDSDFEPNASVVEVGQIVDTAVLTDQEIIKNHSKEIANTTTPSSEQAILKQPEKNKFETSIPMIDHLDQQVILKEPTESAPNVIVQQVVLEESAMEEFYDATGEDTNLQNEEAINLNHTPNIQTESEISYFPHKDFRSSLTVNASEVTFTDKVDEIMIPVDSQSFDDDISVLRIKNVKKEELKEECYKTGPVAPVSVFMEEYHDAKLLEKTTAEESVSTKEVLPETQDQGVVTSKKTQVHESVNVAPESKTKKTEFISESKTKETEYAPESKTKETETYRPKTEGIQTETEKDKKDVEKDRYFTQLRDAAMPRIPVFPTRPLCTASCSEKKYKVFQRSPRMVSPDDMKSYLSDNGQELSQDRFARSVRCPQICPQSKEGATEKELTEIKKVCTCQKFIDQCKTVSATPCEVITCPQISPQSKAGATEKELTQIKKVCTCQKLIDQCKTVSATPCEVITDCEIQETNNNFVSPSSLETHGLLFSSQGVQPAFSEIDYQDFSFRQSQAGLLQTSREAQNIEDLKLSIEKLNCKMTSCTAACFEFKGIDKDEQINELLRILRTKEDYCIEQRKIATSALQQLEAIKTIVKERDELKKKLQTSHAELEELKKSCQHSCPYGDVKSDNGTLSEECVPSEDEPKKPTQDIHIYRLEEEIKLMRSSHNISLNQEAQIMKKELECLKQYCGKLLTIQNENTEIKKTNKELEEKLVEFKQFKNIEEIKTLFKDLQETTIERDELYEKVKFLERDLCAYKSLPKNIDELTKRSMLLDEVIKDRDRLAKKLEQMRGLDEEVIALRFKADRVDEFERKLRLTQQDLYQTEEELDSMRHKYACTEIEILNNNSETDNLRSKIICMEHEMECLKSVAKDQETLQLEKERLQNNLDELVQMQSEYDQICIKLKATEVIKAEKDMYKRKYESLVDLEKDYIQLKSELEKATKIAQERDALERQVVNLEKCIGEQEDEIKRLVIHIDSLAKGKENQREKMKQVVSNLKLELEERNSFVKQSEEKISIMQEESSSTIQNLISQVQEVQRKNLSLENEKLDLEKEVASLKDSNICLEETIIQVNSEKGKLLEDINSKDRIIEALHEVLTDRESVSEVEMKPKNCQAKSFKSDKNNAHLKEMLERSKGAIERISIELAKQTEQTRPKYRCCPQCTCKKQKPEPLPKIIVRCCAGCNCKRKKDKKSVEQVQQTEPFKDINVLSRALDKQGCCKCTCPHYKAKKCQLQVKPEDEDIMYTARETLQETKHLEIVSENKPQSQIDGSLADFKIVQQRMAELQKENENLKKIATAEGADDLGHYLKNDLELCRQKTTELEQALNICKSQNEDLLKENKNLVMELNKLKAENEALKNISDNKDLFNEIEKLKVENEALQKLATQNEDLHNELNGLKKENSALKLLQIGDTSELQKELNQSKERTTALAGENENLKKELLALKLMKKDGPDLSDKVDISHIQSDLEKCLKDKEEMENLLSANAIATSALENNIEKLKAQNSDLSDKNRQLSLRIQELQISNKNIPLLEEQIKKLQAENENLKKLAIDSNLLDALKRENENLRKKSEEQNKEINLLLEKLKQPMTFDKVDKDLLENELKDKEALQAVINDLKKQLKNTVQVAEEPKPSSELEKTLVDLTKRLENAERRAEVAEEALKQLKANDPSIMLKDKIQKLESQIIKLEENNAVLKNALTEANNDKAAIQKRLDEALNEKEKLIVNVGQLQKSLEKLNQEKSKLENELYKLKESAEMLRNEIDDLNAKNKRLEKQIDDSSNQLDQGNESVKSYLSRFNQAQSEYLEMKKTAALCQTEKNKLAKELENALNDLQKLSNKNADQEKENAKGKQNIVNLEIELDKLRKELDRVLDNAKNESKTVGNLQKETANLNKIIAQWEGKNAKLEEENANLKKELEKLKNIAEVANKLQDEVSKMKKEALLLEHAKKALEMNLVDANNKAAILPRLEDELSRLKKILQDSENENKDLKKQIATTTGDSKIKSLTMANEQLKKNLNDLENENLKLKTDLQRALDNVTKEHDGLNTLKQAHDKTKQVVSQLEKENAQLKIELNNALDNLKKANQELSAAHNENSKLKQSVNSLDAENIKLKKNLEDALAIKEKLMDEKNILRDENTKLKQRIAQLELENTKLKVDLDSAFNQVKKSLDENKALTDDVKNAKTKANQVEAENARLKSTLDSVPKEFKPTIDENAVKNRLLQDENLKLRNELDVLKKELKALKILKDDYNLLKEKMDAVEKENINLKAQLSKANEEAKKLIAELSKCKQNENELKKKIVQLENDISIQESDINELRSRAKKGEGDAARLKEIENEVKQKLAQLEAENAKLKKELDAASSETKKLSNQLSSLGSENEKNKKDLTKLQAENNKMKKDIDNKIKDFKKANNSLLDLKNIEDKLRQRVAQLENENSELKTNLNKALDDLKKVVVDISKARELEATLKQKIVQLELENSTLKKQLEQAPKTPNITEINQLKSENNKLKQKTVTLENELDNLRKKLENALDDSKNKTLEASQHLNEIARLKQKLADMEKENRKLKQDLKDALNTLTNTKDQNEKLIHGNQKLNDKLTNLENQLGQLTMELETQDQLKQMVKPDTANKERAEKLQNENETLKNELEKALTNAKRVRDLQKENDSLKKKIAGLDLEINKLKKDLNTAKNAEKTKAGNIEKFKENEVDLKQQIAQLQRERVDLKNRIDQLEAQQVKSKKENLDTMANLKAQYERDMKKIIKDHEESIAKLQKSQQEVIKKLNEEHEREVGLLKDKINQLTQEIERLTKGHKNEKAQLEKSLPEAQQKETKKDDKDDKSQQEAINKLNRDHDIEVKKLKDKTNQLRQEIEKLKQDHGDDINKLQKIQEAITKLNEEHDKEVFQLLKEIERLKKLLMDAENRLKDVEVADGGLKKEARSISVHIEETPKIQLYDEPMMSKDKIQLEDETKKLNDIIRDLQNQLADAHKERDKLLTELDALTKEKDRLRQILHEQKRKNLAINEKVGAVEKVLAKERRKSKDLEKALLEQPAIQDVPTRDIPTQKTEPKVEKLSMETFDAVDIAPDVIPIIFPAVPLSDKELKFLEEKPCPCADSLHDILRKAAEKGLKNLPIEELKVLHNHISKSATAALEKLSEKSGVSKPYKRDRLSLVKKLAELEDDLIRKQNLAQQKLSEVQSTVKKEKLKLSHLRQNLGTKTGRGSSQRPVISLTDLEDLEALKIELERKLREELLHKMKLEDRLCKRRRAPSYSTERERPVKERTRR